QLHGLGIFHGIHAIRVEKAVVGAAQPKLVQVTPCPSHSAIQDLVQKMETDIPFRLNAPPDRRLDSLERDPDLINRILDVHDAFPTSESRSRSAAYRARLELFTGSFFVRHHIRRS